MNAYLAEFIGTCFLVLMGDGIVAGSLLKDSKSENGGWAVICIGWGLAVTFAVYAVGSFSGAHINPAVTLALSISGNFSWEMLPGYIAAQTAGAFLGACLVYLHYHPHWKITKDPALKLAVFSTSPARKQPAANFLSEAIGTFVLIFGLLFIGANTFTEGLNPLVVGALVTLIGMSLGGTTGFAINPARDFGPRLAHALLPIPGKGSSGWSYAWVPIVGPLFGGLSGAVVYRAVFQHEYGLLFWGCLTLFIGLSLFSLSRKS